MHRKPVNLLVSITLRIYIYIYPIYINIYPIYIYIYIYIYIHCYTLLVPMNQNLKSHRSKMSVIYIYAIMKTMCPPGYHHNGFVGTYALGPRKGLQIIHTVCQRIVYYLSKTLHQISSTSRFGVWSLFWG